MNRLSFLVVILLSFAVASCTGKNPHTPVAENEPVDLGCSYFYFLWGAHAEFNRHFPEALEAYEKALICDPNTIYIKEKVPVLLLKMGESEKAIAWLDGAIKEDPLNITYRLLLATLLIQQNSISEAIQLYNEVLNQEPDNEGVRLRLGLLYGHIDQFEKAEQIFKAILKENSQSYITRLSLARLYRKNNNFNEAIVEYEKSLSLNWSKDLAYELGHLYTTQELFNDALRIYTTITDNDQFDERAALSRIQALLDLEKIAEALAELEQIRDFSKKPDDIDIIISKVLLRDKKVDQARQLLEKVVKKSGGSEAHYMLGLIAFQEKDYATTLDHLAHIDTGSEEFDEAVYLQTRIYQQTGEPDKAIALLKKHTEDESSRSPLFYALLSSLYQRKGEYRSAIALMEAAVAIFPDNAQLFFEYGMVLERNAMYEQAMTKMQHVLELQPDHAEALNYIGYTWADKNTHLPKALEYIKKANSLKPDNGFIVDSLGWVHYRLGNFPQAIVELERATELEPDDAHIYDHLGDAYLAQGERDKALDAYRRALSMFTEEEKKEAVQRKIDAIVKF